MDWAPLLAYLGTLADWVPYVLMGLGTLVVIGIFIDRLIPDEKDGGFMKKLMARPVLGPLLHALKRFSPFNIKDDQN